MENLPLIPEEPKKKDLISRLEHAEQQHDFYAILYRQYSTDLMKLSFYARKCVTTSSIRKYLQEHHPDALAAIEGIVLEDKSAVA